MSIRVVEYVREDGSTPFKEWFDLLVPAAAAKVAAVQTRLSQGNTSSVKWFGGLGEYVIDWDLATGSILLGTARTSSSSSAAVQRQQRDINSAKELVAEYKTRNAKLKRQKPGEQRRRKKR